MTDPTLFPALFAAAVRDFAEKVKALPPEPWEPTWHQLLGASIRHRSQKECRARGSHFVYECGLQERLRAAVKAETVLRIAASE